MRRARDRQSGTLFRGSELPRLATMVVMALVIWMLIALARDTNTWRWLAPGGDEAAQQTPPKDSVETDVPPLAGPTDLDPAEADAAREELQAVTDRDPLAPEEMPAYWRLMSWERRQSTDAMLARAAKHVTYNDLWQQPERWRGKLIELPIHLRRTKQVDDVAKNPLGLKRVDEVWGWNTESQPYWFWIVTPQLPPGMPTGPSIYEEATFVGYFLKLLPYEDHSGKHLATPLLIGRLIWHPAAENSFARDDEWTWPWLLAMALGVLFVLRWGFTLLSGRRWATVRDRGSAVTADEGDVERWLETAATDPGDTGNPNPLDDMPPPDDNHDSDTTLN